jgi:hypothetical protein
MSDREKSCKDSEWEELNLNADKVENAVHRLMAKVALVGAGAGAIITLVLMLIAHPIIAMLAGFATMIALVVGLILLIPPRPGR